ncbi:MAG: type II secretion system F family protein [Gammaproteobacteria bacterium]
MQHFRYKAQDIEGRIVGGVLEAANEIDVEMRLERMGLELIRVRPVRHFHFSLFSRGVRRGDLINFTFYLQQLLSAGVPMIQALADLRDTSDNPRMQAVLSTLVESIEGGQNLSEALEEYQRLFGQTYVHVVRVGEQAGNLPEMLDELTSMLKWQELPFQTRMLIATSDFFVNFWYVVLLLPFVIFFAIRAGARSSPRFRFQLDRLKLRIPLIGPLLYKIKLARFARNFSLMYRAGITVLEILRLNFKVMDNLVLQEALQEVHKEISEGVNISTAFANVALFSPLVVRMLRVGENTGGLDRALENVSYFYDREVKESIERLEPMIEPALTVVLGAIVGWVMFSTLGPVYNTAVSMGAM